MNYAGPITEATAAEVQQANALAEQWCSYGNSMVLWGASIIILRNLLDQAVAPADREFAIEMIITQLREGWYEQR